MSILNCENLTFIYSPDTPFEHQAISDVSYDINSNEIIGIIGHTGSGKSTFIQHLNGLLKPTSGTVVLNGKDIWSKENKKDIRNVRFAVGLCFQYPEHQIFEESIFKEIAFGPAQMGLSKDEIASRVYEAMDLVGLKRENEHKSPFDLSGGQKRRVAIASIIAMKPQILILDEPCAGLDPKGKNVILDLIKHYQKQTGSIVIFVSHSMEDVAKIADRVVVMYNSKIELSGTVDEVYSQGEKLKNIGLNIPEITEVFLNLKKLGVDCRTDIYTVEQGVKEYKRLLELKEVQNG